MNGEQRAVCQAPLLLPDPAKPKRLQLDPERKCGSVLPPRHRKYCSERCYRRARRADRRKDADGFGEIVVTMVTSLANRIGGDEVDSFRAIWSVFEASEQAAFQAITGLRAQGLTWTEIAGQAGKSRQAMTQWYERRARNETLRSSARQSSGAVGAA